MVYGDARSLVVVLKSYKECNRFIEKLNRCLRVIYFCVNVLIMVVLIS